MRWVGLFLALAVSLTAADQLRYVLIFTRHGVRSPTWTADRLNEYSAQPWPEWHVPAGSLTAHGRAAMKLFGAWYGDYLRGEQLLGDGCADAGHVHFQADKDPRTVESARAIAEGMLPKCKAEVQWSHEEGKDPLYYGAGDPDTNLAAAAVLGRIGRNQQGLDEAYEAQLDTLERVLGKKSLGRPGSSADPAAQYDLMKRVGPLTPAATLSENLALEYAEGMSGDQLGWGRLSVTDLRQILALHTVYADLMRRTPYIARARASNLVAHLLWSMQQAVSGKPVQGALGAPQDKALVICGHDTNIENMSGMLGLDWIIGGYPPDDTPPGGALVFELRSHGNGNEVRVYYTAQTPDQLRRALPLTAESPPERSDVFIPGCSSADAGYPCEWEKFRHTVENAIDPAFVSR